MLSNEGLATKSNSSPPGKENFTHEAKLYDHQPDNVTPTKSRVTIDFVPSCDNTNIQVLLRKGETVRVMEKSYSGWWYVEAEGGRGWAPGTCLEEVNGIQNGDTKFYMDFGQSVGKPYVVKKCYSAEAENQLTVRTGNIVNVLEKRSDGWWLAEYQGVRGLIPGCHLTTRMADEDLHVVRKMNQLPGKIGLEADEASKNLKKTPSPESNNIDKATWSGAAEKGESILYNIGEEGTYMIRKSQRIENQQTLAIYTEARIIKYTIKHTEGGQYSLSKQDPAFDSVCDLIGYYQENFLPKTKTKLRSPYKDHL